MMDPVAWAKSQTYTVGRSCSICENRKMLQFATSIVKVWASKAVKNPHAVSWPKVAEAIQREFGTRTHWFTVREHFRKHNTKLYDRVERRRRGET